MPSAISHGSTASAAQHACAAGVYTSATLLPLCATLLESFDALDQLEGYVSTHGRAFYGDALKQDAAVVTLKRNAEGVKVPLEYTHPAHANKKDTEEGKLTVVPYLAGQVLGWVIA